MQILMINKMRKGEETELTIVFSKTMLLVTSVRDQWSSGNKSLITFKKE